MGFDIIFVALTCGELLRRKKIRKMTSYGLIGFYILYSIGFKVVFFNDDNYNKVFFYNTVDQKTKKEIKGSRYFYEREHMAAVYLNVHAPLLKPFWWLYSYLVTYYCINYDTDFMLRRKKVDNFDLCHEEISRDNTKKERFEACSNYLLSKVKLHKEFNEDDLKFMNKNILDVSIEDCREKRQYGKYFERCLNLKVMYRIDNLIRSNFKYENDDSRDFEELENNKYFSLDKIFWQFCKEESTFGCDHFYDRFIDLDKFVLILDRTCSKEFENNKIKKYAMGKCFDLLVRNLQPLLGYRSLIKKLEFIEKKCSENKDLFYCSLVSRVQILRTDDDSENNYTNLYMIEDLISWNRELEGVPSLSERWNKYKLYRQGIGELYRYRYKDIGLKATIEEVLYFREIPYGKDDYEFLRDKLKSVNGYRKDVFITYYIYSLLKAEKNLPDILVNNLKKKFYKGCKKKDWKYCVLGLSLERNLENELRTGGSRAVYDITKKYCKLGFLSACHTILGYDISLEKKKYAVDLFCNHKTNYNYSIEEAKKICSYHIGKFDKK